MISETRQKTFIHLKEAWYGETSLGNNSEQPNRIVDSVLIMLQDEEDDGCFYEFSIDWILLGGDLCPELSIFSDAWKAFAEFGELFHELVRRHGQDPTPESICELLEELHYENITPTKYPYDRSDEMKMVTYTGHDEVLVCPLEEEHRMLAEYFNDPDDRNIEEYDRDVCIYVVRVGTRLRSEVTDN